MNKAAILICSVLYAVAGLAQDGNREKPADEPARRQERKKSDEGRHQMREQRLQLMKKSLENIGVSEEQREAIEKLQAEHRKKMAESMRKISEARKTLSRLQDEGADRKALDEAISAVGDAQEEQLRILVYNRMEMETILGSEKYSKLMESARAQFRKHGRKGGSGLPPRPGLPPIPESAPPSPPNTP